MIDVEINVKSKCFTCLYAPLRRKKAPCSSCIGQRNYRSNNVDCTTCEYSGRPLYKSPCSECEFHMNYSPKREKENETMENKIRMAKMFDMTNSDDYKKRLTGEYLQLKHRYEKLRMFNVKIRAAEYLNDRVLMPDMNCPPEILLDQERAMKSYMDILEKRIVIEGIDLEQAMEEFYEAD